MDIILANKIPFLELHNSCKWVKTLRVVSWLERSYIGNMWIFFPNNKAYRVFEKHYRKERL